MSRLGPPRGLTMRVSLLAIVVAFVAIAMVAVGVLVVAQSTFDYLMVKAGSSASLAHEMFDHGVAETFIAAAVSAAAASVLLAFLLASRIARPLAEIARAARRVAAGDYGVRVPRVGPEELSSLADSFNQMASSLAQQEQVRRDFIVNAAHEIRTPLTNLQGYLEGLRDGVIEPSREQFESLHEEAQRLMRLSRSLDELANIETTPPSVGFQEVDLARAVRSAYELARSSFDDKAIEVKLDLPERLRTRAQPDHLAQVLANLFQNAARYTPAGGEATVRAEAHRTDVLISITNSGAGIPRQDLPHIFDRFYRVDKSRDAARGGAGIGLAIVKELVEADGGRVGAESVPGTTRFWFSLPS